MVNIGAGDYKLNKVMEFFVDDVVFDLIGLMYVDVEVELECCFSCAYFVVDEGRFDMNQGVCLNFNVDLCEATKSKCGWWTLLRRNLLIT
jgi:hypothetical protein